MVQLNSLLALDRSADEFVTVILQSNHFQWQPKAIIRAITWGSSIVLCAFSIVFEINGYLDMSPKTALIET